MIGTTLITTTICVGQFALPAPTSQLAQSEKKPSAKTQKSQLAVLIPKRKGEPVARVAFSPDGKFLVAVGPGSDVRIWNIKTRKLVRKHRIEFHAVDAAWSGDGSMIGVAGDRSIHIWNAKTGQALKPFPKLKADTRAVAFSPDGKFLACRCFDQKLRLWNVASRELLFAVNDLNGVNSLTSNSSAAFRGVDRGLTFSPDGRTIATANIQVSGNMTYGYLHVLDATTGKIQRMMTSYGARAVALSPDGRVAAFADGSAGAMLMELATGAHRRNLNPGKHGVGFGFGFGCYGAPYGFGSPYPPGHGARFGGGAYGFGSGFGSGFNSHQFGFRFGNGFGQSFGYGGFGWPLPHSPIPIKIEKLGHGNVLTDLTYSPNGRYIVTVGRDNRVLAWDAFRGKPITELGRQSSEILTVAYSPTGKIIATGSRDGSILLWNAAAIRRAIRTKRMDPYADRWRDLGSIDANVGYRAMVFFADNPARSVEFLRDRIGPPSLQSKQIQKWINDLNSGHFRTRSHATKHLERYAHFIEPGLRQALLRKNTLEVDMRLRRLLDRCTKPDVRLKRLRHQRGVEVLERMDTADSRRVLLAVARGAPELWITVEAQAALKRLNE